MFHFIFELEAASSDPIARCDHGQNRSTTSESDVVTVRQYHGNVCVYLVGFLKVNHNKATVHNGVFAVNFSLTPFWRSSDIAEASFPMINL